MEFPSNAHSGREDKVEPRGPSEEKKVGRVAQGEVVRRKKPLGKKLKELFIGGDSRSVGTYIFMDVLIPAAKDMISDAGSQFIDRMMFPDQRPRPGHRGRPTSGYTNYRQYSGSSSRPPWGRDRNEDPRREVSRRGRATHDFDEILLESRGEAEAVIDALFEIVSKYDQVTVADLYDCVGITGNYTDQKWGWTDIRGSTVARVKGGYLLDLPRPEPLD